MGRVLRFPMARKSGSAYPVDEAWRERVEHAMAARDPKWTRADLARESGLSPSTISDLLNRNTNECVGLPEIHAALGWLEPYATLSDREELLLRSFRSLDEFGQGELTREALNLLQRQHGRPTPQRPRRRRRRARSAARTFRLVAMAHHCAKVTRLLRKWRCAASVSRLTFELFERSS